MKPKVLQIKPGAWYCFTNDDVTSFGAWQEALREANRVAWQEKESKLTRQLPDNFHVVEQGTHDGYQYFIAEGPMSIRHPEHDYKQYNGYVAIPEGHPFDVEVSPSWEHPAVMNIDVHGGITYESGGIIGFDTLHLNDYAPWLRFTSDHGARRWTLNDVREETLRIIPQLKRYEKESPNDTDS